MAFRNSFFKLFGRREKETLRLITEHMDSVFKVVEEFRTFISSLISGDIALSSPSTFEAKIDLISVYESLADDLYLKSLITLCEGAFFSGLREDFIRLLNSIDDIADHAKDSTQILARSRLDKILGEYNASGDVSFNLFLDKVVKTVEVLRSAAYDLEKNSADVIKKSIKVKELEEEADDIKWKLLRAIFSRKIDSLALLELKDFILTIDGIADAAAQSSETLITIVMKARA